MRCSRPAGSVARARNCSANRESSGAYSGLNNAISLICAIPSQQKFFGSFFQKRARKKRFFFEKKKQKTFTNIARRKGR
jgi:hypothetical protein